MPKEAEEVEAARLAAQARGPQISSVSKKIQEIESQLSPLKHLRRLLKSKL